MMKKLVFFLFLLLVLPGEIFGALTDYTVYFINGMDNEPITAKTSRDRLHALVLPDVPDSSVQNLYQSNNGSLLTMIDRVRQMAIAENSRETFKRYWRCYAELSSDKCNATVPVATDMRQMILDTLGAYSEAAYVQNPQLQAMVATVTSNYNNGKKTLLVAHSQGNFYANQIVNFLQTAAPTVAACTNIVGIASPATYVPKNGPYKTRYNDAVISAAGLYFPGQILPANYAGPATADWSGHKFVESYIQPSELRGLIRNDILAQTATAASSTCPLDCTPFNDTYVEGPPSFESRLVRHIGQGRRTIRVRFDSNASNGAWGGISIWPLNSVPIYLLNQLVYVSGTYWYSFDFDSAQLGTEDIVVSHSSSTTGYTTTVCVDCGSTTGPGACH